MSCTEVDKGFQICWFLVIKVLRSGLRFVSALQNTENENYWVGAWVGLL